MRGQHYGFAHRRRRAELVAGGVEVNQCLIKDGGAWTIDTGIPDGYFVEDDGKLVIDETVGGGLEFTLDGPLTVNT